MTEFTKIAPSMQLLPKDATEWRSKVADFLVNLGPMPLSLVLRTKSKQGLAIPSINTGIMLQDAIGYPDIQNEELLEHFKTIVQSSVPAHQSGTPVFIHLAGLPGSGKTMYSKETSRKRPGFSLVSFDDIMVSLPGYQKSLATFGPQAAFRTWEAPARTLGYHLLSHFVETRCSILFDHGAASKNHLDLVLYLKEAGYHVEMHYIECSVECALERVRCREAKIARHTPEELIYQRAILLSELLPRYKRLVDQFLTISPELHSEQKPT